MDDTVEVDRELLTKGILLIRERAIDVRQSGNRGRAREVKEVADSLSDTIGEQRRS